MASSAPSLLSHPETILPKLGTGTGLQIGGIWGQVKAGQTWQAGDGKRLILSADSTDVVYLLDSKVYVQNSMGFANEVRTYPIITGALNARGTVELGYMEVKLAMGLLAGASGVGFAIVIGTEITEFIVENRDDFHKWSRQLQAVLKARAALKQVAPVLYDKVFSAILRQVWKDVKGNMPESVTPEVVIFGVGVVIGTVGKKIASGKFSILALAVVVGEQILIRTTTGVLPKAIKVTGENYAKMAPDVLQQLRTAGVHLSDNDVKKIFEEVQKHPLQVRKALEEMAAAFK
jgi:hypothetical protein